MVSLLGKIMKIHEMTFQIAACCVISAYCSKLEENEQLYVLIDPESSTQGSSQTVNTVS